jgi:hypothetical protein
MKLFLTLIQIPLAAIETLAEIAYDGARCIGEYCSKRKNIVQSENLRIALKHKGQDYPFDIYRREP